MEVLYWNHSQHFLKMEVSYKRLLIVMVDDGLRIEKETFCNIFLVCNKMGSWKHFGNVVYYTGKGRRTLDSFFIAVSWNFCFFFAQIACKQHCYTKYSEEVGIIVSSNCGA